MTTKIQRQQGTGFAPLEFFDPSQQGFQRRAQTLEIVVFRQPVAAVLDQDDFERPVHPGGTPQPLSIQPLSAMFAISATLTTYVERSGNMPPYVRNVRGRDSPEEAP